MSERTGHDELHHALRTLGADLSRWAPEDAMRARAALLASPELRRAYEEERVLDQALRSARDTLDLEARLAGAGERVRRSALARIPANPLAGIEWRKLAAAVLVAGVLGGGADFLLADPAADAPELVMLDPLEGSGDMDLQ